MRMIDKIFGVVEISCTVIGEKRKTLYSFIIQNIHGVPEKSNYIEISRTVTIMVKCEKSCAIPSSFRFCIKIKNLYRCFQIYKFSFSKN